LKDQPGSKLTAFIQFCGEIKGKEQVLAMMDMPKHIQIGKAPLISFYFVIRRTPLIFASGLSNRLTVALAMDVHGFQAHLSKI